MHPQALTRKAIETVEIEVDPQFVEICRTYLEQQRCSMRQTRPGWWLVGFPPGTVEEERKGLSTQFTRRSYIILPSNVEMPLYFSYPLNPTQHTRVAMGFPPEIFPD